MLNLYMAMGYSYDSIAPIPPNNSAICTQKTSPGWFFYLQPMPVDLSTHKA